MAPHEWTLYDIMKDELDSCLFKMQIEIPNGTFSLNILVTAQFSDRMMIPHHDWVTQFDSLEQPFWQGNIRYMLAKEKGEA